MYDDIRTRLKLLLTEKSMTAQKLAEITSIELSSINNILYGRSKKREHVDKIARVLDVSSTYIAGPKVSVPFNKIDIELYDQIINIIRNITNNYNITEIEYHVFFSIVHSVYEEALLDKVNLNHIASFSAGIIKAKIDAMLITCQPK